MTHHGPGSGEATTFPLIVFSVALRRGYIQVALFPRDSQVGVPKLFRLESGDFGSSYLPTAKFRLEQGLNKCCSSPQELFNAMSHTIIGRREEVDSRLLMVGSHIASLTLRPSFAHNLGCKCPNGQCKASLDI
jgi:hypothetical protein